MFTNTDDVIDSRDIIKRIEELESDHQEDEAEELATLKALAVECEKYSSDWEYGETLIHRNYFKEYMDEMIEDCYELPRNIPYWISITIDYDALEQDYTTIDFDGEEYLIRCV